MSGQIFWAGVGADEAHKGGLAHVRGFGAGGGGGGIRSLALTRGGSLAPMRCARSPIYTSCNEARSFAKHSSLWIPVDDWTHLVSHLRSGDAHTPTHTRKAQLPKSSKHDEIRFGRLQIDKDRHGVNLQQQNSLMNSTPVWCKKRTSLLEAGILRATQHQSVPVGPWCPCVAVHTSDCSTGVDGHSVGGRQ